MELHFNLEDLDEYAVVRPATAPAFDNSIMMLPEFAAEVYGFLDRAHIGTSLLANRGLNELIFKLRNRLPGRSCIYFRGEYWIIIKHFRRELPYSDSRRFKVPSEAGPAAYCSLVLRYLSNSHVSDFIAPESDFRFSVKMLAALADRNFSAGTVRMSAGGDRLTDYRSMDAVFGRGMRLDTLELSLLEHEIITLVKTTDFFRMPTVQKLKSLKLELAKAYRKSEAPRRWAVVSSPLWIDGIHLLPIAERFEVNYQSDRLLPKIGRKLVELCEKFERDEVAEVVQHFKFVTPRRVTFPFKDDNKTASGVNVDDYAWDVYRFRNAATGDWLTACVGHERSDYFPHCVLHIVRGEAYPDDTFGVECDGSF